MRFLVRRSSEADPQQSSRNPHCSFCGKSKDKVQKLIAGPRVYICDECVELCNRILAEESSH